MSYNIIYYENERGKSEVREFIRSLSLRLRSKAIKLVDLLELFGTELDMPYAKPLGDGLFELRPNGDNKIARVLYFFHFCGDIIITNGFIKKTENPPNSAIDKANILRTRVHMGVQSKAGCGIIGAYEKFDNATNLVSVGLDRWSTGNYRPVIWSVRK